MFDWLIGPLLGFLSGVGALRDKVKDALTNLWSTLVDFFTEQRQAAQIILDGGVGTVAGIIHFCLALEAFGFAVLYIVIPAWARNAIDQVTHWVVEYVAFIVNVLRQESRALQDWARGWINYLYGWIRDVIGWAEQRIAEVWHTLTWTYDRVAQLLTVPDTLAQWLFAALWRVGERWVLQNAVALGRWALAVAVTMTLRAARIIEDIIVQVI